MTSWFKNSKIQPHNIRYRLEVWQTPEGEWLCGELPPDASWRALRSGLAGLSALPAPSLPRHPAVIARATARMGHRPLRGADRCPPQRPQRTVLCGEGWASCRLALAVAPSSRSMIRGRRIKGKNGYVTPIGNDLFAWFCSTESKSRINFLQLLQAGERPAIASLWRGARVLRASRGCPKAPVASA